MSELNLNTVVCRHKDILSSSIDEETILLSIENSKYYGIDPVGSTIWQIMETPISLENIIITLQSQYNVPQMQCHDDVFQFVESLLKKNLITASNE